MNLFEDPVEELARIIAVFEKAVEDEAEARVELAPIGGGAEQEIPHHKMGHADQSGGRRLESGETFQRRVAFAAEPQDLTVELLFAREMPEQERLGNARSLGEFFSRRPGEAFASEKRHGRRDDRLTAFIAV